jgi:hypothetical protein
VRGDGYVVAAGEINGQIGWAQFRTNTLSGGPIIGMTDFPGSGESARGVAFLGVNRVVVAGLQTFNGDDSFALARFETHVNLLVDVAGPESDAVSLALRLHPAFPNPLVGRSVIAFELGNPQPVRVALYDVAGRRVRTLADQPFDAGRHERVWDGTDDRGRPVAAGIYLVRAESATATASEKILMLR